MREFMVDLLLVVCQVWSQYCLLRFKTSLQKLACPLQTFFFYIKIYPFIWLITYAVNVCVGEISIQKQMLISEVASDE